MIQILENTSAVDWNFTEGVKNPAHICSRGVFSPNLLYRTEIKCLDQNDG